MKRIADQRECVHLFLGHRNARGILPGVEFGPDPEPGWVRLFFVGGPISLSGGGEAGGNWIRQGVVRSGGGSGGRRYFCRQRPMGDFRWSSRAS